MTLNTVLTDKEGNPLAPATTAEQVAYNNEMNVKQAIDAQISQEEAAEIKEQLDGLNGNNEYSIEEQAIGKWIDGRTLYRKVYTGTTPLIPGVSELITGLPSSEIIDYTGYILNTGGTHMNIKGYYLSDEYFVCYPQGSTFRINLSTYQEWFNRPYVLILTYIK